MSKVIFVTTSQACHCTVSRCEEVEVLLNNVLSNYKGKVEFEKLDYSLEPSAVEEMARMYNLHTLPSLLFFDKTGRFNGKLDYKFDEESILHNIEGILDKR